MEFKVYNRIETLITNATGKGTIKLNDKFEKLLSYTTIDPTSITSDDWYNYIDKAEFFDMLDTNPFVLRPHNLKDASVGSGYCLFDMGKHSAAVINLSGQIYLERLNVDNPFKCVDELLERAKNDGAKFIFVDFHAEATSEKRAMGFYLDGKVSAVFGTHTHVQTADAQILPQGTGYITDLGMTGVINSTLGVKNEIIINRLKDNDMSRFEQASGKCMFNGCIFDVDDTTGLVKDIKRIYICDKD